MNHETEPLAPAIRALEHTLLAEPDLRVVMDAFFDVCMTTHLQRMSQPARNARLETLLTSVLAQLEGRSGLAFVTPVRCAPFRIIHGLLTTGDRFGAFFYFEDLDSGVCSLATADGMVHFARFSVVKRVTAEIAN